jgi:hypothetical protein
LKLAIWKLIRSRLNESYEIGGSSKFNKIIMTELEKNEIHKVKLREAYLEAGADWVIFSFKDLKKLIDHIDFYKMSKN